MTNIERLRMTARRIMMDSGYEFDYATDRVNHMTCHELEEYIGDEEEMYWQWLTGLYSVIIT